MSKAAQVRGALKHPVVDADGHWLELQPIFQDYVREVAGPKVVDQYIAESRKHIGFGWYDATPEERMRSRIRRHHWWGHPMGALDRTAAMIPGLFYDRLDDFGIDVALIYPTLGFNLQRAIQDDQLRYALVRAYNVMAADMFRPFADRLIPAAVIPLQTPSEAVEHLEHARSLGMKLMMMNTTVARTIEADADWQPDPRKRRVYIDSLGLDSPYDYDPVWKKCVELKVAVTSHSGSMGWPDRISPSNFVANHLGHFAQDHHLSARSLFMGGVTERFPTLNFGFLEGGVGWACNLYADLLAHWKKRNKQFLDGPPKPTNLDRVEVRRLMERYTKGNKRFEGKIDSILARNLDHVEADISQEELEARDLDSDDFSHVRISGAKDVTRLYARRFFFGCEADDPMTGNAFNDKAGIRLKSMLGSDISHFDVLDGTEVLEEAWEMVEHGLLSESDFREFTYSNVVQLHCQMNPDFFKGTIVEKVVAKELERADARDAEKF